MARNEDTLYTGFTKNFLAQTIRSITIVELPYLLYIFI